MNSAARELLRGFGRGNEEALHRLATFDDWRRVAASEIERRTTLIVQSLDDDTLKAIASGSIDFQALCREVAADLAAKAA